MILEGSNTFAGWIKAMDRETAKAYVGGERRYKVDSITRVFDWEKGGGECVEGLLKVPDEASSEP
jgi:hypothetical protein